MLLYLLWQEPRYPVTAEENQEKYDASTQEV